MKYVVVFSLLMMHDSTFFKIALIQLTKSTLNPNFWRICIKKHWLSLFRMGVFGAAHLWGIGGRSKISQDQSLKSVTYILQWGNLVVISYLKKIQKIYESRDTWVLLKSAFFHWKSANFVMSRNTDIDYIFTFLILLTFLKSLKFF